MEKYYVSSIDDIDFNKRIKLVEITYSRKAPSFGIVYVSTKSNQIRLKALELSENKETHFVDLKRSDKPRDGLNFVDYDTLESLSNDEREENLSCIALTSGPNSLNRCGLMNDGALIELELDSNQQDGSFLWCRLNCLELERYIHLLSHKSYLLLRTSPTLYDIEQINRYSLCNSKKSSSHLTFTGIHLFPSNVDYALLELSDKSLRIINGERGYSLINLDLDRDLSSSLSHFIFPGDSSGQALLLTFSHNSLTAHSVILNQNSSKQEDPDGLLLCSQDSLEVEKCWVIDFEAIESLRTLDEDETDEHGGIYICPLWSPNQISAIHAKPKYLAVGKGSNLLVYSFESLMSSSFPLIYDRFFMKDHVEGLAIEGMQVIDEKIKPTMVHNFKLIGGHNSDALWNTIFLATGKKTNLINIRHFQQMGLVVALTNNGHLMGFRFDSDEISAQKGNLYQQQIADSIRGSSGLLLNTIEMLQNSNLILKQNISKETTRMQQETPKDLENLVFATLAKRSDIGAMYSLSISISDLVQVNQIVITSSVNSSFMKPTSGLGSVESIIIDNNYFMKERGLLLADADPDTSLLRQKDAENINACILMDIKPGSKNVSIELATFVMDGKNGRMRIYFLLDGTRIERSTNYFVSIRDTLKDLEKYYEDCSLSGALMLGLNLRMLRSYHSSHMDTLNSRVSKVLKVSGSFSAVQMLSWLDKCIECTSTGASNQVNVLLYSRFTYCSIKMKIQDGLLELSSDDMFAREIIRKQILEEATSLSIRLNIEGFQSFSDEGLEHLLRMQYNNIEIISKISKQRKKEVENFVGDIDERDLLLELFVNEMNLNKSRLDFKMPPDDETVNSLRQDIENEIISSMDSRASKTREKFNGEERGDDTFRSLICGYILDCLADYDKFKRSKVDEQRLVVMQAKLLQLILDHSVVSMDSFADGVLKAWESAL